MTWNDLKRDRQARIVMRLVFLIACAAGLAFVCRQGSSLFEVGTVLVVYVVAATLWVRGQHQASVDAVRRSERDPQPWTFPFWASVPALGFGAVLLWAGFTAGIGAGIVTGALLMFFGAGYVLMRCRMYGVAGAGYRPLVGGVVIGLSVVLILVGLEEVTHGWAVALVVIGFAIAPIGLSLLAEPAIRWLQSERAQSTRRWWALAAAATGVAILVVDAVVAVDRVDSAWVLIAFAAIVLLVVAIVSSTQADIAVVIAAICLMGVTPMSEDKPEALTAAGWSDPSNLLVALGDSYMSGEGAHIFYVESGAPDGTYDPHENHCNRAPTSWAASVGQTRRLFSGAVFLACSGARTRNVVHEVPRPTSGSRRAQFNEPATQLDQIDDLKASTLGADFDPKLVVISIGGNDAGFSTIGAMCIAPGNCGEEHALWDDPRNLRKIQDALSATYQQVRAEFPDSPVLAVLYPAPVYTVAADDGDRTAVACDQVALSQSDLQFVSDFLIALNDRVEAAARANGVHYLAEMESSLAQAHLQLCDPDNDERPGINFIGLRSVSGVADQRFNPGNWYHNSLHPNERGHAAMRQAFEDWWSRHSAHLQAADAAVPAPVPEDVADAVDELEPLCDITVDDQSTNDDCRAAGATWAKEQVSKALLEDGWGPQLALVALGGWLVGVALFGWRKPWWQDDRPVGDRR